MNVRFTPKADKQVKARLVRFVPIADIRIATDLCDHLVGTLLKQRRHVEAKSLGGL
jgi:hypothetical protein